MACELSETAGLKHHLIDYRVLIQIARCDACGYKNYTSHLHNKLRSLQIRRSHPNKSPKTLGSQTSSYVLTLRNTGVGYFNSNKLPTYRLLSKEELDTYYIAQGPISQTDLSLLCVRFKHKNKLKSICEIGFWLSETITKY